MRLLLLLLLAAPARALPPLGAVEGRVGGGLAVGGGTGGKSVTRGTPMTIGFLAELTLHDRPWTTAYVGAFGEFIDRVGLGLMGGVRLRPTAGGLRLGAGAIATVVPYTLFGVSVEAGYCWKVNKKGRIRICGDAQGVVYFVGGDLPDGRVAGQLNALLGVNFDAW